MLHKNILQETDKKYKCALRFYNKTTEILTRKTIFYKMPTYIIIQNKFWKISKKILNRQKKRIIKKFTQKN